MIELWDCIRPNLVNDDESPAASTPKMLGPTNFIGDPRKLFVGGLPLCIDDTEFATFFSEFGDLLQAVVMVNPLTTISRGFGFLTYADPQAAQSVLSKGRVEMRGKSCEIKPALPAYPIPVESKSYTCDMPALGIGLSFDNKYDTESGLLSASNLRLERFLPGRIGTPGYEYQRADYVEALKMCDYRKEYSWCEGPQSSSQYIPETDVGYWSPGTTVHLVIRFGETCDGFRAFLNRRDAEQVFRQCEANTWETIRMWRVWDELNLLRHREYGVFKTDPWHCDLLERSSHESSKKAWHRPNKGETYWLVSVLLE